MIEPVKIEVTLTAEDFARAIEQMRKKNPRRHYLFFICLFIASLIILVAIINDPRAALRSLDSARIIGFFLVLGALWALFFWFRRRRFSRRLKRAYQKYIDSSPLHKGSSTYRFSEEGLSGEKDLARIEMKWSAYTKVEESDEFFFLYTSPYRTMFIQKKAFSPDDLKRFQDILHSSMGEIVELELQS